MTPAPSTSSPLSGTLSVRTHKYQIESLIPELVKEEVRVFEEDEPSLKRARQSSDISPSPVRFEDLPNELIVAIINRLGAKHRDSLSKTSTRLRRIVESECVAPAKEAYVIFIDFHNEVCQIYQGGYMNTIISREQHKEIPKNSHICPCCISELKYVVRNMGEDWHSYVSNYLRKLNKTYQKKKLEKLEIVLPATGVPELVLGLKMKVDVLFLSRGGNEVAPLPQELFPLAIRHSQGWYDNLMLPIHLITRSTRMRCCVTVENALSLIMKTRQGDVSERAVANFDWSMKVVDVTDEKWKEMCAIVQGIPTAHFIPPSSDNLEFHRHFSGNHIVYMQKTVDMDRPCYVIRIIKHEEKEEE